MKYHDCLKLHHIASQITRNTTVCTAFSDWQQNKIKSFASLALCEGNSLTGGILYEGPGNVEGVSIS